MPRNLDPAFSAALSNSLICPFFAVDLAFKSTTVYVGSLPFPLVFGGNTYVGVGDLGQISTVKETIEVQATGITVTLSGVDTAILQECLSDIQIGAPATVYFGVVNPGTMAVVGSPCIYYAGYVDAPTHTSGVEKCSISLPIESRMLRLQSGGQQRRYTSADQRLTFPDDTFFSWVEQNNDLALKLGVR